MTKVAAANLTVTIMQIFIVGLLQVFLRLNVSGIVFAAAVVSGILAISAVRGTWLNDGKLLEYVVIGFSSLSATFACLALWALRSGQAFFAIVSFSIMLAATALYAQQAKKHWAKQSHALLFVAALPYVGYLFRIVVGAAEPLGKE